MDQRSGLNERSENFELTHAPSRKGGGKMLKKWRNNLVSAATAVGVAIGLFMILIGPGAVYAAVNSSNNVAGGSHALGGSGNVTVTAAALGLVKQVWVGGSCMASSNTSGGADSCNGNVSSVTVPAGTTVQFLIYVRNTSDVALTDIRFNDVLDTTGTGFTYVAASIKRTTLAAGAPTDVETAANIRTNAANAMSDTAGNDEASHVGGTINTGLATDAIVAVNAHKTYGIMFNATKN